jgi:hypothetical protein
MTPLDWTDNGLLVVDCGRCEGRGWVPLHHDRDWCPECGGEGHDFWDPAPLVRNLVVAGALCAAYRRGRATDTHYPKWRPNVDCIADVAAVEALGKVPP